MISYIYCWLKEKEEPNERVRLQILNFFISLANESRRNYLHYRQHQKPDRIVQTIDHAPFVNSYG